MHVVAGVDLGGTAINYTLLNGRELFLIESLFEHPARSKEGPDICLQQIEDGLKKAVEKAGVLLADVVVVGLDTPGPASADGVLSAEGSTNFLHPAWSGFDIRGTLEKRLGKPVTYLIVWKSEKTGTEAAPRTLAPFSGSKFNAGSPDDCGRFTYDAGGH